MQLSNNAIESIPREIGRLQFLDHIALDNNKLKEVPSEIASLRFLEFLSVSAFETKTTSVALHSHNSFRTLAQLQ
jgi:Leucine-rich repeat (LRR) protein